MSTMENKELKEAWSANSLSELFDAKRTVEANRRRQEELRRMMAASAAPKSRRLWPVWALSAAACLALILITLPMLFRSESTESVLVAEAKVPVNVEQTHSSSSPKRGREMPVAFRAEPCVVAGDPRNEGEGVCKTADKHTPPSTLRVSTPSSLEGELADAAEEPILIMKPMPVETEEPEETIDNGPRIHRRTSTRLANSDNIVTIQTEPSGFQNLLASVFASETSTPVTLKTIEF